MSDWKEYKLDELVEITSSKRIMRSEYQEDGIPFFRSKEIIELNSGNEITTELFISKERFLEIKNKFGTPSYGDILLTSVGTLGVPYFVNYKEEFYFKDGNLTWFRKFNNILRSKYLYYWFSSPVGRKALKEITIGSTQPALTIAGLKSLTIHLPTLEEQDYIIEILDHLSSKIHLNTQINQTLEQIAQALFKSWFVDFDPVRAKVQALSDGLSLEQAELAAMQAISGKTAEELTALSQTQPDHYAELAETAKAFPCEMVEVDGVEVPKGWEVKPADELFDIGIGKTPPRKETEWFSTNPDDMQWISIKDMGNSGVFITESSEFLTNQAVDKFNIRKIPENTVLLSFKLTIGRVSITTSETTTNEAIAHFKITDKSFLTTEYLYLFFQQFDFNSLGSTSSIATAVNSKTIKGIEILIPNEELIKAFQMKISNIFAQIKNLTMENKNLVKTRDLLLPKLLNGEI